MENPREIALRAHIQDQLLDYANEHININHVAYTEYVATKLLSDNLRQVSLFDATNLALPEEPLVLLLRQHSFQNQVDYIPSERLPITIEIKDYLIDSRKKFMSKAEPPSTRHMRPDDSDIFELPRPISPPIITRTAFKATRKFMNREQKRSSTRDACALSDALDQLNIPTAVIHLDDDKNPKAEDLLGLRLQMSAADVNDVKNLLSRVPFGKSRMTKSRQSQLGSYACEFLNSDALELQTLVEIPRALSPPLFPRAPLKDGRHEVSPMDKWDKFAVANFVRAVGPPLPTKDDEIDIMQEHMAIIDGWTAYIPNTIATLVSTSRAPSLQSGESESDDQIDEILWNPTPPNTQPSPDVLIASYRLDDYEIPRSSRPRSGIPPPHSSVAFPTQESLQDFLHSFREAGPKQTNQESAQYETRLSPSLAVQPSLANQDDMTSESRYQASSHTYADDLDTTIRSIYAPVRHIPADSLIMDARIDDGNQLLMEVPQVPEPNIHPLPKFAMPKDFYALLSPSVSKKVSQAPGAASSEENIRVSSSVKLTKAPGIASLNIELSWRPTVRGTYIPTHEELAAVMTPSRGGSEAGDAKHTIERFAIELKRAHNSAPPFLRGGGVLDTPAHLRGFGDHNGLILTRAERQLVRGTFGRAARESKEVGVNATTKDGLLVPPYSYDRQERQKNHPIHHNPSKTLYQSPLQHTPWTPQPQYSNLHPDPLVAFEPPQLSADNEGTPVFGRATSVPAQPPFTDIPPNQPRHLKSTQGSTGGQNSAEFSAHSETIPVEFGNTIIAADSLSKSVVASIARFRRLHDQTVPEHVAFYDKTEESPPSPQLANHQVPAHHISLDLLCDDVEMRLAERWQQPVSIHRYIASLSLIQKRALASALSSEELGCIQLIERAELQGDHQPDLIIDPHRAVLFTPISHLPTSNQELMTCLKTLLASYSKILLIFEAYPCSCSFGSTSSRRRAIRRITGKKTAEPLALDPFSPPVLTALKRFRRELTIERELAGHDRADIGVQVICARNIEEAAMYTRLWGTRAETECDSELASTLWDERTWLKEDENEDASDLAQFPGMNIFASILLLSHVSPNDFIDLDAASRLHSFGRLVGHIRMQQVNDELKRRQEMLADVSSEFLPTRDTQ